MVDPDDAGRIAELVGGLPLGLELAAAHCVTLDARELIDRLGAGGALLEMTDPRRSERHASLGRVLDAGLRVLDDDVRSCVSLLSVLPGDFDLAVASTVMDVGRPRAEDVLRQAIDASVLARAPSRHEGARYRILWPVRQHLDEQLTDAERDLAAGRHAAHVRRFAARYRIVADTDLEAAWTERAAEDDADLRAAFAWYEHHDAEGAIVIATAASRAAWQRGDQRDAARVLGGALDRASSAPAELVAWATEAVCWPEFLSGQIDRALAHSREAIERFEVLGDARGLARALRNQAHALHLGGVDAEVTTPMYRRSIEVALTAGSSYGAAVSQVQYAHALTAFEEFDVDDIEPMLDEACAVLREAGDRTTLAHAELSRVFLAFARGDVEGTRAAAEEMMRLSRLSRSLIWQQIAAVALGVNAFERGDEGARRRHFADAVRWAVETDNEVQLGIALWSLAPTLARSDPTTAARLWGAARARSPLPPLHRRRYGPWIDDARTRLGERFADLEDEGSRLTTAEVVAMCEPSG